MTNENDQMRTNLSTFAKMCDHFKISDRAASAVSFASLKDFKMVSPDDNRLLIDRSKVRRERMKQPKLLQETEFMENIRGLYFDGQKDKTLIQAIETDGSKRQRTTRQEHFSIVVEPDSTYFDHVTPSSGSAINISEEIMDCMQEKHADVTTIAAIGYDSTSVNTGSSGGVIRMIEKSLRKPLQRIICLLHSNELPLRHFFCYLDDATTGPRAFSGEIGKALQDCETLAVFSFIPIMTLNAFLFDFKSSDLSSDQKYLAEICQAITSGKFSKSLHAKYPGNMSHSR